ncbi:MAG: 16S rRNA (cytidine(1402)-2'-O)-methyltransferase [Candidatus Binatus sp.]|uniref:16S rRNA (cytidine(1402)-2'-O)-methyltransferase n=1 Tax=Candidatus Binatus sp. TaxID=2811406 RepID=UPI00271D64F8|nr:16S rRNA (cytidine(1402)-2'-O)-methyltransferase [Candidatus Binatus sp.]MDO8433614.1 16S rRNA (cytidine(1402)-2'-O)-methyltransferase [Candidatus Binatus sp.]
MSTTKIRQTAGAGVLYVVATPIGNADDISARAIRVLSEVDAIACEDTRRTGLLLAHHAIRVPMISYYEHNEERRTPELIERMAADQKIALVTDAGTPAISDPGFRLVRAALDAGIKVIAVPGACAAVAALSIAGLATNRFTFEGFLPQRGGARRKLLEALRREHRTMVFYEAARRLADTLAEMAEAFGGSRKAAVVREITKTYEETIRGTLDELAKRFREQPALGEVTIVVEGAPENSTDSTIEGTPVTVEILREAGLSLKQASAVLSRLSGRPRREIYQDAIKSNASEEAGDE